MSLSVLTYGFENMNINPESPRSITTDDIINRGPPDIYQEREEAYNRCRRDNISPLMMNQPDIYDNNQNIDN
jgi:hypothetical protein